ncbi:MAG: hypothetical protein V1824_00655 [archaeon]
MEIELEKHRNDLLNRTAIFAKIRAEKTPSRKEILKKVSAMIAAPENLIVIDKISQNFGEKISNAYIKVYDNLDTLKKLELNYKLKRTGLEAEVEATPKAEKSE